MKSVWCWRCQAVMPMFDSEEFSVARRLYGEAFTNRGTMEERFQPLIEWHEKMTGLRIEEPGAIIHHELDLLGPTCLACGKPLRTPQAAHCAECGKFK